MSFRRPTPYWLLFSASLLWLGLIVLAPVVAQAGWNSASFLYRFFAPVCHQLPERSFRWMGEPLAVCARCSGIYLGFSISLLIHRYFKAPARTLRERPRLLFLYLIPMALDLMIENTALSRLLTGMIAAFPVSLFVWMAVEEFKERSSI